MNIIYFHYLATGLFLFLIYNLIARSIDGDRPKRKLSLKQSVQKNFTGSALVSKYFYNERIEDFLALSNMRKFGITSIHFNLIRHILLYLSALLYVLGLLTQGTTLTTFNIMIIVFMFLLTSPLKINIFFDVFMNMINKQRKRSMNSEVYSLYMQLKAEFQSRRVGNVYNLLLGYRPFYKSIRPAIESVLFKWNEDKDKAWDSFAKYIDTHEAETLATIMKEVEYASQEQSLVLIEQKRDLFASNNTSAYQNYLKSRESWIYLIVFSTASGSILINMIFVYIQFFTELMGAANNIGNL